MIKKSSLWLLLIISGLQSCSVNTETTYYKDSATSMESNILLDKSMLGMLSMMGNKTDEISKSKELGNLSTDWKSLFDLQKDEKNHLESGFSKSSEKNVH